MKKKQADKLESERRTRMVAEWILQGHAGPDIINQCMAWNITDRQARRYVEKGNLLIKQFSIRDLEDAVAWHIEARKKLYKDLEQKTTPKGVRAANAVLDSIAKIEGVMIEKHEHTGDITIKDLIQAADEYEAKDEEGYSTRD